MAGIAVRSLSVSGNPERRIYGQKKKKLNLRAQVFNINESFNEELKEFLAKSRAEVRHMSIFEYDEEATRRAISENSYDRGMKDGVEQGIGEGIPMGELRKTVAQVCKKMKMNQSAEKIAEDLVEEISTIEPIFNAAKAFAPDYEPELVFKRIYNNGVS